MISERIGVYQCTAFQVRLGGSKGVLVTKPEIAGEGEFKVQIRPSQMKFKTDDYFLEVVRGSTFTQGYLNR